MTEIETPTDLERLPEYLERHRRWAAGEDGGRRLKMLNCNLTGADFSGLDLHRADFTISDMSGADLSGANLQEAELRDCNLTGANLREADLRHACLAYADLRDCNLTGANLRGADLRHACLAYADLRNADLRDADLRDANLDGANLMACQLSGAKVEGATWGDLVDVPVLPSIHEAVFAVASEPGALNMSTWHACMTTHCRAGWVTTLAGPAGQELDDFMGTDAAAALIYAKSDPFLATIPDWHTNNDEALADMERRAVADSARVSDSARVFGSARVSGSAQVYMTTDRRRRDAIGTAAVVGDTMRQLDLTEGFPTLTIDGEQWSLMIVPPRQGTNTPEPLPHPLPSGIGAEWYQRDLDGISAFHDILTAYHAGTNWNTGDDDSGHFCIDDDMLQRAYERAVDLNAVDWRVWSSIPVDDLAALEGNK